MKRYRLEPLAEILDVELTRGRMIAWGSGEVTEYGHDFAETIGIDACRLPRMLDPRNPNPGLSFYEADIAAVAVGRLPWELWPEWEHDDTDDEP